MGFSILEVASLPDEALDEIVYEILPWRSFFIDGNPLDEAISCLMRLHYLNGNCPPLQSLFRDMLRFFTQKRGKLRISDVEGIIDNIQGICRQIKTGKMPQVDKADKSLQLLIILQKSLFILCKGLDG
jgi:hypothetical protein